MTPLKLSYKAPLKMSYMTPSKLSYMTLLKLSYMAPSSSSPREGARGFNADLWSMRGFNGDLWRIGTDFMAFQMSRLLYK